MKILAYIYLALLIYIVTPQMQTFLIQNCILQLILFILSACIPAYITGRMSYVDLAWPWGLVLIGVQTLFLTGYWLRRILIGGAFLFAGLRMGFGGLMFFLKGKLKVDFPRYDYQRLRWKEAGIPESSFAMEMQFEILVQFAANASTLIIPSLLQGFYTEEKISAIEIFGWILWLCSFLFESIADSQKLGSRSGREKVMIEGLWKTSRHPNYFGEWMVWNSLIITSIPSFLSFANFDDKSINSIMFIVLIGGGLISISATMYWCLVYYTGAIPAEYYSVLKR